MNTKEPIFNTMYCTYKAANEAKTTPLEDLLEENDVNSILQGHAELLDQSIGRLADIAISSSFEEEVQNFLEESYLQNSLVRT